MDAPDPSPRPSPPVSWAGLALAALLAVAVVAVLVWIEIEREPKPVPPGGERQQLTVEETVRLDKLKWEGIGLLEAGRYEEAEAKFQLVGLTLPTDQVVLRNIAISRVLRLDTDRSDEALQDASSAVDQLIVQANNEAVGYWLLAKRAEAELVKLAGEAASDEDLAMVRGRLLMALERCCNFDPSRVAYVYAWSRALQEDDGNERLVRMGRAQLRKALELEPNNLCLLIEAMRSMASAEDERFAETADRFLEEVRPLRRGLSRKNIDIEAVVAQAKKHAAETQWTKAFRALTPFNAVLNDDIAQADRRRVDPHLLEFVQRDFTSATPAELPRDPGALPPLDFAASTLRLEGAPRGEPRQVAWGDADLDDSVDLWVLSRGAAGDATSRLAVFERTETAGEWREFFGVDLPVELDGLRLGDLDRDEKDLQPHRPGRKSKHKDQKLADLDVVVFGPGGVRVLVCEVAENGDRSFRIVPQSAGLDDVQNVRALALGDLEQDGDLDLCIATGGTLQLWINRGRGEFDPASEWSILPPRGEDFTDLAIVDLDRDVDLDVVAVGPGLERMGLLENHRHLNFRWRNLADVPRDDHGFAGVRVFEADGNASWDLALVGDAGVHVALSETPRAGTINLRPTSLHTDGAARRLVTGDFDDDACQDLVTVGGDEPELLRGLPSGTFAPGVKLPAGGGWRAADAGDFDGDGDLDLVAIVGADVRLLTNQSASGRAWLDVETRGSEEEKSGRVNHLALGSVVEVRGTSGRYQAQVVQGPVTHFGLGADERAAVARVIFTNGIPQAMVDPDSRQVVREVQKNIGSCPYLYVWNGREFEFYTDLLWAAPLGLLTAEGRIMPDRSWEYLKVDGDKLAVRDGHYELLLTEELWEAGYFDQVELIAVDHPADVEIYSNEKVGPPDLAKYQVHTVRRRREPVAARDSAGRDQTEALRARDGRYATCFSKQHLQGLVETHYLELDLGRLESPRRITLFLTGWIRPTDTSLNLAIEQNPALQPPRPPRILVPATGGEWREASPFMGFPGGKPKTIAVDLTGLFAGDDYRLRIETSQELRWDEAFFTIDEEPAECRTTSLDLVSADLRYGGYSRRIEPAPDAPEWFDRTQIDLAPQWPPMRGAFTRFGDVRPLLVATDDRLAILGAGDEIHVRFRAPPPPPPGWKRDFLLHNVGWDKDCVLNTVLGQTVEPLPFQAMKSYPYADQDYPDTPELREYLRTYQTRRQSFSEFWKRLSAPPRN